MRYTAALKTIIFAVGTILTSCDSGLKTGSDISKSERQYIKSLGLLDHGEQIILLDQQSDSKTSGNFFSDRRIASYWIDSRDKSKNSIDFEFYPQIDTILTKDLTHALTYSSYLEVVKKGGQTFRVYVDGDSTQVWAFFKAAISEWSSKKDH